MLIISSLVKTQIIVDVLFFFKKINFSLMIDSITRRSLAREMKFKRISISQIFFDDVEIKEIQSSQSFFFNIIISIQWEISIITMFIFETQSKTTISIFKMSIDDLTIKSINSLKRNRIYNIKTRLKFVTTFLTIKSFKIDKSQSKIFSIRFFIVFYFSNINRQKYNQFKCEIRIQKRNFTHIIKFIQITFEFFDISNDEYQSSLVFFQLFEFSFDLNCFEFSLKSFNDIKCSYFDLKVRSISFSSNSFILF